MPISEKNLKILWSRAGGRCSFPLCNTALIQEGTENNAPVVVGEIAHIVARHPEGPRGKEPFQGIDRDIPENLILLCPVHHAIIDQQPQTYTVEVLTQMKNQHEQSMKAQLDLYNHISSPVPHYQIHNTAPIQGIAIGVVTPWNWTPGKVKARRYTRPKKGVHNDTPTKIYSRIQNTGGA